jgi:hypothetical protein
VQNVREPASPHWRSFDYGEGSVSSGAEQARSESAGISPEVAVRLQRLAFERVTDLMC